MMGLWLYTGILLWRKNEFQLLPFLKRYRYGTSWQRFC